MNVHKRDLKRTAKWYTLIGGYTIQDFECVQVSLGDTKLTQYLEEALAEVSFGEWLKRRRSGLGLTQDQLALQINVSTSALRK